MFARRVSGFVLANPGFTKVSGLYLQTLSSQNFRVFVLTKLELKSRSPSKACSRAVPAPLTPLDSPPAFRLRGHNPLHGARLKIRHKCGAKCFRFCSEHPI